MVNLVRYAHLKYKPLYGCGESIRKRNIIGTMGNTGISTSPHLHFDIIQEEVYGMYRLKDIPNYIKDLPALMKQYNYFIDDEMFNCPIRITTSFGDPRYDLPKWVFHPAFDLIPSIKKNTTIFWNRSKKGIVHKVGTDNAYGNYIIIKFNQ